MKPYIKLLVTIKNISVWQVDGNYIRNNKDVNFTNSGHHYTFAYIPKNEIWIDKDFSKHDKPLKICSKSKTKKEKCTDVSVDEDLLISQAMNERKMMKNGMSYLPALDIASKAAKKERKERNNISLKDTYNHVYIKKLKKYCVNGIKVWLINGKLVRDNFYIHFTEGGHNYVYKFVPLNEIWIDDSLNPNEYGHVLFHEAIERNLMKYNKMTYHQAHDVAIKYEGVLRSNKIVPDSIIMHELNRKK